MKERYYFGIEEIVANSFIELNKIENVRQIPLVVMEKYGNKVVNYLNKDCNENRAFMILSRNNTAYFEDIYSDYFYIEDSIVFLKDNIEIKDLIDKFRGYMSLELLMAFVNKEVVDEGLYNSYYEHLQSKVNNYIKKVRIKK